MKAFTYDALPGRVVFGPGKLAQLKDELDRLGSRRALLIITGSARKYLPGLQEQLGGRLVGVIEEVAQHVPVETVKVALATLREVEADCAVTLGGGSAIGLGKALALEAGLKVVAVPTTFSGSEMTPIYGLTENGRKKTGRDMRVLPRTVIFDPQLVYSLPPRLAVTSGLNAMAHCVEALYGKDGSPVTDIMAEEGCRALAGGLLRISRDSRDLEGYDQAFYGAYLGGALLGAVGTALHHKLCHVLGGTFNLPHSETHSVMLPYVVGYNREAAPEAMARLQGALQAALGPDEAPDAVGGMFNLSARLDAPRSLAELGMPEDGIEQVIAQVMENLPYNPRPVEPQALRELLRAAYHGEGLR